MRHIAVSLEAKPNAISYLWVKQSTHCGGPVGWKTCKQNSFCVGVVRQAQSIVKPDGSNKEEENS